jgi:hypothetical protein
MASGDRMTFDHYNANQKAWSFMDELVIKGSEDGININKLILLITRKYPVSEKAIVKRITRLCEAENLTIEEGTIKKIKKS